MTGLQLSVQVGLFSEELAFPFYVWTNLPTSKRHNDVRRSNLSIDFIREVKLYETLRIHYVK